MKPAFARPVVIQSYRTESVPEWLSGCMTSVRDWAAAQGYDYRHIGDEIFDMVPAWYRANAGGRAPVITDLARLLLIREELSAGRSAAIWFDADVLIFDPDALAIDLTPAYAFGRERWVQPGPKTDARPGSLKVYRNVHNAVAMFRPGNAFLKFYIHACERILKAASGSVPNQVVGPKFLTAIHNIMGFDLIDTVGMLSPLVLRDLHAGGGPALDRLIAATPTPLAAANLCSSMVGAETDGVSVTDKMMDVVCEKLMSAGV